MCWVLKISPHSSFNATIVAQGKRHLLFNRRLCRRSLVTNRQSIQGLKDVNSASVGSIYNTEYKSTSCRRLLISESQVTSQRGTYALVWCLCNRNHHPSTSTAVSLSIPCPPESVASGIRVHIHCCGIYTILPSSVLLGQATRDMCTTITSRPLSICVHGCN